MPEQRVGESPDLTRRRRPALGDAALKGALAAIARGLLMKVVCELGTHVLGSQAAFASPTWGAVHGAVRSRLHPPMLIHGLLLGGLVYAANVSSAAALPSAGIVPAHDVQSPRQRGPSLAAHAACDLATAAAYEAST